MQSRESALIREVAALGTEHPLTEEGARRAVSALARAEKRKPAPSTGAQARWCVKALWALFVELADVLDMSTWTDAERANAVYKAHRAAGNPQRAVSNLEQDVPAYTHMVAQLWGARRPASCSVPRYLVTRRGFLSGCGAVLALGWLLVLQFWVSEELSGSDRVRQAAGAELVLCISMACMAAGGRGAGDRPRRIRMTTTPWTAPRPTLAQCPPWRRLQIPLGLPPHPRRRWGHHRRLVWRHRLPPSRLWRRYR